MSSQRYQPSIAFLVTCFALATTAIRPGEDHESVSVATVGPSLNAFGISRASALLENASPSKVKYGWTVKGADWVAQFFGRAQGANMPKGGEDVNEDQEKLIAEGLGDKTQEDIDRGFSQGLQLGYIVKLQDTDHNSFPGNPQSLGNSAPALGLHSGSTLDMSGQLAQKPQEDNGKGMATYIWTQKGADWASQFFAAVDDAGKPKADEKLNPDQASTLARQGFGGEMTQDDVAKGLELGYVVIHSANQTEGGEKLAKPST